MPSAKRDISAAKRFFKKVMRADLRRLPLSVSVDKHASSPAAFAASQEAQVLPFDCRLRRTKYLTNRALAGPSVREKEVARAGQCFRTFHTAERTLEGVEAMHLSHKGAPRNAVLKVLST